MSDWIRTLPMKTVCLGRFVIQVPEDSQISYGPARLDGWRISTINSETDEQFDFRLQAREQQLRASKNEKDGVSFESVSKIATNEIKARIFIFGRRWNYSFSEGKRKDYETVEMQAMVRAGRASFTLHVELAEATDEEGLTQLIKQFKQRANEVVPTEAGFCFDGGLIREPLNAGQSESTGLFVSLAGHPDVSFALHTLAGYVVGETLLQRDAKASIKQRHSSLFHILRQGPRALNGIPGEEVLERVNEPNGVTVHGFMWESYSKKDDVYLPSITLEMDTGNGRPGRPVQSSLSDAAVLALWDKISSSLRVRAVIEPVTEVVQVQPHAKNVYANRPCPATGWWSCTDGDNHFPVQGGVRQRFQQGVRMPQAVLLAPPTAWQKIKGERPTFSRESPTLWNWAGVESPPSPECSGPDLTREL